MNRSYRKELLEEIRWLADVEKVAAEWTLEKPPAAPGVDAPEFYSILFDDLGIMNIGDLDEFSDDEKILILEFARVFQTAARKNRKLYNARALLRDPHFRIAQKIASLL